MRVAWKRAAKDYLKWRRRLADQGVSIPKWRNSESGTPDEDIEAETVAGVEIQVDTSTAAPRLPARIQAVVLGAAIGEATCAEGLWSLAERATWQWREKEVWLAKTHSTGVEHPCASAVALYGALELRKRDDEETKRREDRQRHRAKGAVWKCYGTVVGLCLSTVFGVGSALQNGWVYLIDAGLLGGAGAIVWWNYRALLARLCLGPVLAFGFGLQIAWIYWGLVTLLAVVGYLVGDYLKDDDDWLVDLRTTTRATARRP